jgi:hypothetical protein
MSFTPIIQNEHVNDLPEILTELNKKFTIERSRLFPFVVPLYDLNLIMGLRLRPR